MYAEFAGYAGVGEDPEVELHGQRVENGHQVFLVETQADARVECRF
jgi:hypothetical protein